MIIHDPAKVISPRDFIDNVKVLFNGWDGSPPNQGAHYSVAVITWDGVECIGIRWNVSEREWNNPDKIAHRQICVGEPNSRGYPTWFILPDSFLSMLLVSDGLLADDIRKALQEIERSKQPQEKDEHP